MRGKTIVVTGGGSGIGRAVSLLCAEQGANLGILDIHQDRVRLVAEEALGRGANKTLGIPCDVRSEEEVS